MTFLHEPADSPSVRAKYDAQLATLAPPEVGELVTWGRPIEPNAAAGS